MSADVRATMTRRAFAQTMALAASTAGLTVGSSSIGARRAKAATSASHRVGINLAGPTDWNTELPLVDVFRSSRAWLSQREGAPFDGGPKLELDAGGWVKRLEPGAWAETPLCGVARAPAGDWTVLYDGVGTIEIFGTGTQMLSSGPGRLTFRVAKGSPGGFFLRLLDTAPNNYVRNIRVLIPGSEKTYARRPFNPSFLARWHGMAVLRFMDFMQTNHSPVTDWSSRAHMTDATFATKGMAPELLVSLANELGADAWFCMPHGATDDYVNNFARYVKENLDPSLRVYVEYSNEVWNTIFTQHRYASDQGLLLRLSDNPFEASLRYYARRSLQIFRLWERVFEEPSRLVRVIAAQAGNAYTAEAILSFENVAAEADALAIAPYVSFNVTGDEASTVSRYSKDRLFAHLDTSALAEATGWIRDNKKVADRYKLKLIAYEGGQHLSGIHGAENNDALTELFMDANQDPRMGELYRRYHKAWEDAGGELFCHFSSVSEWNKWGSWGLLQQHDDDPAASPKFCEVMRWAQAAGQDVIVPG